MSVFVLLLLLHQAGILESLHLTQYEFALEWTEKERFYNSEYNYNILK